MNTQLLSKMFLSASLMTTLALSSGCGEQISHTESDKPGWFGGRTQTETTVIQNRDGSVSTEHSSKTTN